MAGEMGRVRKGGVRASNNHAGPGLPLRGTTFRIMFGPDARKNLDALTPALDGDGFCTGLDNFVAEKHQMFLKLRGILTKRQEDNLSLIHI